ncbi:MAG: SH3 domain-containing protein [Kamptonema sp. SIO4C4]|nr:SH3 domain-containing protein [Kamptonema sp. SIO4C4]
MNFSKLAQFILGVVSGLLLLGVSGAATGYYFFSRMAANPPRPVFSEERPDTESTEGENSDSAEDSPPKPETAAEDQQANPEDAQDEEPEEPEEPEEELEPGAYKALVTWPDGLSLRDEPSLEAERIGGIAYEQEMIILETSNDGRWERVRIPGSDQEGWVKAGNSEPVDEEEE